MCAYIILCEKVDSRPTWYMLDIQIPCHVDPSVKRWVIERIHIDSR